METALLGETKLSEKLWILVYLEEIRKDKMSKTAKEKADYAVDEFKNKFPKTIGQAS